MTVSARASSRQDAGAALRRRAWAALLAVLCALAIVIDVDAGEVPSAPILRIETGRHTAFIQSLALDERQQRLYTVSDDKTIRGWQLPELTPLATYRIPIGAGYEGQLYTAALSPDGQTLAVAGWTGWQWDNKGTIYLLDAASGEIKGRVGGFDEVVGPLAYSADGRYLALGLLGKQGLHVLQTSDYSEIAWDIDYHDKTIGLAFTPQGRIITTALDGSVRLYDSEFQLIGRVKSGLAGTQPFGARQDVVRRQVLRRSRRDADLPHRRHGPRPHRAHCRRGGAHQPDRSASGRRHAVRGRRSGDRHTGSRQRPAPRLRRAGDRRFS